VKSGSAVLPPAGRPGLARGILKASLMYTQRMYIDTHICVYIILYYHMHVYLSHTRTHACTHARTHARMHARTHAYTHTCARAHARGRALTHKHLCPVGVDIWSGLHDDGFLRRPGICLCLCIQVFRMCFLATGCVLLR